MNCREKCSYKQRLFHKVAEGSTRVRVSSRSQRLFRENDAVAAGMVTVWDNINERPRRDVARVPVI